MDEEFLQELVNRRFRQSKVNGNFFFKKVGEFMITFYAGKMSVYISDKNAIALTEVVRDGDETLRQMISRAWDNVYVHDCTRS